MMPWGRIEIDNVAADGNLTQLFPEYVTPGTGATTQGNLVRKAVDGVLHRCEISQSDANGGTLELWDIAGQFTGASNNTNTGTALTDAYLAAEKAAGRARLIWRVDFKGDVGNTSKIFQQRTTIMHGLAARYILIVGAPDPIIAGDTSITLNIEATGCYTKVETCGV